MIRHLIIYLKKHLMLSVLSCFFVGGYCVFLAYNPSYSLSHYFFEENEDLFTLFVGLGFWLCGILVYCDHRFSKIPLKQNHHNLCQKRKKQALIPVSIVHTPHFEEDNSEKKKHLSNLHL